MSYEPAIILFYNYGHSADGMSEEAFIQARAYEPAKDKLLNALELIIEKKDTIFVNELNAFNVSEKLEDFRRLTVTLV